MTTDRELLQSALHILDKGQWIHPKSTLHDEIRARLAEKDEKPVAWLTAEGYVFRSRTVARHSCSGKEPLPLYRSPRQPVRLSDQDEKQEADFVKWWERDYGGRTCRGCAEDAWKTAQQAERERIKDVVAGLLDPKDPWIHFSTLLEKIDGPDGI